LIGFQLNVTSGGRKRLTEKVFLKVRKTFDALVHHTSGGHRQSSHRRLPVPQIHLPSTVPPVVASWYLCHVGVCSKSRLINDTNENTPTAAPAGTADTAGHGRHCWPKNDVRRLCRRGGVKRMSGLIYEETRAALKGFMEIVIRDAVIYTEHDHRKTVSMQDILHSLKRNDKPMLYTKL
jgi:histone H4